MEFNSYWKWMSIVVTDKEDGKVKLYIKGADSEILKRLANNETNKISLPSMWKYIDHSSLLGFWVLIMAYRELTTEEL